MRDDIQADTEGIRQSGDFFGQNQMGNLLTYSAVRSDSESHSIWKYYRYELDSFWVDIDWFGPVCVCEITSARSGLPRGRCSCWPYAHPQVSEARWAPTHTRSRESPTRRSGPLRWSPSQLSERSLVRAYGSTYRPAGLLGTGRRREEKVDERREEETKNGTEAKCSWLFSCFSLENEMNQTTLWYIHN